MATAMKRAIAAYGINTGNGYGKEGGGHLTVATMVRHKGHSCLHYDWREGGNGGNGPWFVCVFWCVWRDHKKYGREQNCECILELIRYPPHSNRWDFWQEGSL
jgi:hypothetical protein